MVPLSKQGKMLYCLCATLFKNGVVLVCGKNLDKIDEALPLGNSSFVFYMKTAH